MPKDAEPKGKVTEHTMSFPNLRSLKRHLWNMDHDRQASYVLTEYKTTQEGQ